MIVLSRSKNAAAEGPFAATEGNEPDTSRELATRTVSKGVTRENFAGHMGRNLNCFAQGRALRTVNGYSCTSPDTSGRGSARPPGAEPPTAPANPPWRGPSLSQAISALHSCAVPYPRRHSFRYALHHPSSHCVIPSLHCVTPSCAPCCSFRSYRVAPPVRAVSPPPAFPHPPTFRAASVPRSRSCPHEPELSTASRFVHRNPQDNAHP